MKKWIRVLGGLSVPMVYFFMVGTHPNIWFSIIGVLLGIMGGLILGYGATDLLLGKWWANRVQDKE